MKAVLISIQPKWCELIASGIKTVEVRKSKPKIETPFKVYIYETNWKDNSYYTVFHKETLGKVIGEFVCKAILPISISYSDPNSRIALREFPFTCLSDKEIMDYLGNGKEGYGWCISDLVIYDKPKELSEFYRVCEKPECDDCPYLHFENTPNSYEGWCMVDEKTPLKRPPQSWCYVEELKEGASND